MDLYGDLLGKADEKADTQQPLLGTSWMSLKTKSHHSKQKTAANESTSKDVKESAKEQEVRPPPPPSSSSATKFTPSTLLFKPRQTAVPQGAKQLPTQSHAVDRQQSKPTETVVSQSSEPESAPKRQRLDQDASHHDNVTAPKELNKISLFIFNTTSSFEVEDPYDPRRPNDYFTVCKQREEAQRKKQLAEENRRKMEENERHRAEVEKLRREAIEKQDFKALAENSSGSSSGIPASGGRGRGVSNLPAWLIQKMQQEGSTSEPLPDTTTSIASSQFEDASSMK